MARTYVCKRRIAIVCIVLILSFLLMPLLSHTHPCTGSRCEMCALLRTAHELLLSAAIPFFVYSLLTASHIIRMGNTQTLTKRDCTPVGRKVKLSD